MKVTFVSNYINHHQIPFCEAMRARLKEDFCFVQTEPMEEERIRMGWGVDMEKLPYLRLFYEKEAECRGLIADSDVVLFGGVEDESYIAGRLKAGKLVVRLSERIYKSGQWKAVSPRGLRKKYNDHTRYRRKNVYLLCCGGYVASDFHLIRAYPDKMFQWGYFPPMRKYDIDVLMEQKRERRKREGKMSLLWAGRFLPLKHPEKAIRAAAGLKEKGIAFSLTMVGGGELEEQLKGLVKEKGLEDEVRFTGFLTPDKVRACMEEADIFLFTSDYNEGWGAVINEAMNSGCAVVAGCDAGAVPFLITPGKNGLIYPHNGWEIFYDSLAGLVQNPGEAERMGREAYRTIVREWNAQTAADRLVNLLEELLAGRPDFAESGVLSKAPVIAPGRMYRFLMKAGRKEHGK
mgnify:CR=1 FL=1